MVFVPLAAGSALGGGFGVKGALFAAACLALFFAHHPLSILVRAGTIAAMREERFRRPLRWSALYLGCALGAFAPLILVYGRWGLLPLGAAGLAVMIVQLSFYFRRSNLSLASEALGAAGLTLSAPGAYDAVVGTLDGRAFLLWLFFTLYFWGGILYVKMRVSARTHGDTSESVAVRLSRGRRALTYYSGLVLSGGLVSPWGYEPPLVVAAFGLLFLKTLAGAVRDGSTLNIQRMGFAETA